MLFNSYEFIFAFLPIALLLYYGLKRTRRHEFALAALVPHEKAGSDPRSLLRQWVGPDQHLERVVEDAAALLKSNREAVQQHTVFGLWCQDDGCGRFIRPVAVRRASTPTRS